MDSIATPRRAAPAAGVPPVPKDRLAEPATDRALWPTFMRRTLDEHIVGRCVAEAPRAG
jgi:hypothetical protein